MADAEGAWARFLTDLGPGAGDGAGDAAFAAFREDRVAALSWLDRTAQEHPSEAWPWVLRAGLLRADDQPGAAQQALGEAFQREPSGGLAAERARLWEEVGDLPLAVAEAANAVRLDPRREHRLLKAHLHSCWREYELAAEECGRVLEQEPADAEARFLRSKAWSTAGRLDLALADAEELAKGAHGDTGLFWRLQLLILNDREGDAAAGIDAILRETGGAGPTAAQAFFYQGYGLCRAGHYNKTVAAWDSALAQAGDSPFARKTEFYRTVGRDLAGAPAVTGPVPRLLLAGLGIDPPFSATVEALRALRRCDLVFNNVTGDEIFELLRLLCRDVRPLAYHQVNEEVEMAEGMLAEVRRGRAAAFVTRGHPIVYGGLGRELVRRAREEGLSWRCLASLSSVETFLARHGLEKAAPGFQVLDSGALLASGARVDPEAPLVVYMGDDMRRRPTGAGFKGVDGGRWRALGASLARWYGDDHDCLLFENRADETPRVCRAGGLDAAEGQVSCSTILFVRGR